MVEGISFEGRPGREKLWGLPRPGELGNEGGLVSKSTGVWGALVFGRDMVSSLSDVSILRIIGREEEEEYAAAAAATLGIGIVMLLLELEAGIRGEKLPGALCWERDCCIIIMLREHSYQIET